MGAMVSRTDKDRPYWVQTEDPLNRRFLMVTGGWYMFEPFWKKMTPASQCLCCSSRHFRKMKRKRRSGWRREVQY